MSKKTEIEYYDLWKHFSTDVERVKEKLWTISTWIFTLLGSVLGFTIKFLNPESFVFSQKPIFYTACGIGLVLCIYAWWMITSYGKHIRTAWNRTDFLRGKIDGLEEVWLQGYTQKQIDKAEKRKEKLKTKKIARLKKEDKWDVTRNKLKKEGKQLDLKTSQVPDFVNRIRALVCLFGLAFLILIVWCMVA